jgi:ATP-dependent Clp protease ATP-binding subunit ClpB
MSVILFFFESRVVKVLLKQGADPNARDEFINVNATARKLSLNPLQVLKVRETEFSDRLNSRSTFKGFTPLHYAVLTDNRELIRLVLDSGADPLAENDLGHRAQEYCGNDEVRQLLVEYEEKVGVSI